MNNKQLAKQAADEVLDELHGPDNREEIDCVSHIIASTYEPHINKLLNALRECRDGMQKLVMGCWEDDGTVSHDDRSWELKKLIAAANKHLEGSE